MSSATPVSDLLYRWEAARRGGRPLSPEELCRDCPERLGDLKHQIEVLEMIRPLLAGAEAITTGDPPAAAPAPPPGGSAGRYRPVRPHAKGGLGEVLLADDEELNRPVALKRIREDCAFDPAYRRRFLREAEITARLQHPGVVPVYGLTFDDRGRPCYAMRFIEGESLDEAVKRFHAPAPPAPGAMYDGVEFRQLLQRFVAVCNAIAYAHSRGIVHRDLKPANVMLGRYGETLVVDWGLAKPVGRSEADRAGGEETLTPASDSGTDDTEVGQPLGTPAFMPPEQAAGAWDDLGQAADIFSLGATLYALLTGQAPYSGHSRAARERAKHGEFAPPRRVKPDVPAALEAVCLRAMALRPQDRYATALELAAEVERWLAGEPVRAYPEPWTDRARRWVRGHRQLVTGAAAALVVGAAGLVIATVLLAAANERERLARHETEQQRDDAREQRRRTREALDDMTSREALGWLAAQKTLLPQQKAFLRKALTYYREFAREAPDDESGREQAADAHDRVGLMLEHLGSHAEAEAALGEALAQRERLRADFAGEPRHRRNLATSFTNLGSLRRRRGQAKGAETAYRRSIELGEELVAEFPTRPEYARDLAKSHSNLGVLLQEALVRDRESEIAYRRAIALLEPLRARSPDVPLYRSELAQCYSNLAALLNRQSKTEAATAAAQATYRQALDLLEPLKEEFPDEPDYRRQLAAVYANLSVLLKQAGKFAAAEAPCRKAIELREGLRADFPHVPQYRADLADSSNNLGTLLRRQRGRTAEAAAAFRRAVGVYERLTEDFPAVPEYATDLSRACTNLGSLIRDAGDPAGSLEWYARAVRRLQPTPDKPPELPLARLVLNFAYQERARALSRLRRSADALNDWDRAVALAVPAQLPALRLGRAADLARVGQPARAVAEAEAVAGPAAPAAVLYDAACVCALASAAAPTDGALADHPGARAVELLRRAFAGGFANLAHMLRDSDLDPIRRRGDYAALLWDLADRPPPRP